MDRSEVITLVKEVSEKNAFGVFESTKTQRDVFCSVESITRAEFFDAGRAGLNPEYKFVVFFGDYDGEKTLVYKGKTYGIYRTFHAKTDVLELYAEKKGGSNAQNIDGQAAGGGE